MEYGIQNIAWSNLVELQVSQGSLCSSTVSFGKTKFESQTQTEYLATTIQGGAEFYECGFCHVEHL